MLRIFLIFLFLSMYCFCFADDHIYTNDDLQKYYSSDHFVRKNFVVPDPDVKKVFVPAPDRKKVFIREPIRVFENVNSLVVKLHISGCPTLQNALDGSGGNSGYGDVEVLRRGRSLAELCESVGAGCLVCFEMK